MKQKIYRAGTIPYTIENSIIKMLFMVPSDSKYGGDCPQIAKGKQEEDEDLSETAIREAEEELGLKRGNILNLFKIGTFLGRTEVYAAKVLNPGDFGEHNFETKHTIWLSIDEFLTIGRDLHKQVVLEAYECIKNKEQLEGDYEWKKF